MILRCTFFYAGKQSNCYSSELCAFAETNRIWEEKDMTIKRMMNSANDIVTREHMRKRVFLCSLYASLGSRFSKELATLHSIRKSIWFAPLSLRLAVHWMRCTCTKKTSRLIKQYENAVTHFAKDWLRFRMLCIWIAKTRLHVDMLNWSSQIVY